jgi:hypothetical protein
LAKIFWNDLLLVSSCTYTVCDSLPDLGVHTGTNGS